VAWVLVTLLTCPATPQPHTAAFYSRMRIPGPGWKTVRDMVDECAEPGEFLRSIVAWLCCILFLFSLMLGVGKVLFHAWGAALAYMAVAALSGLGLRRQISRMRFLSSPPAGSSQACAESERSGS